MKFAERIDNIPANCFVYGDYHDGFYQCRDEAARITEKADELITKLFIALDMHDIHRVDELKEEYGL
ncbi:hypothetical protein D3C75_503470 [compost metagenome]